MLRVNVFKFVVLMGTFALAMAFAGNDLVNFIGVPLAGMDSFRDYVANSNGLDARDYMMTSLMESAQTPPFFLLAAGVIMIVAMATSKKARNVIKTSVDLSRQDEGDEMFGSSRAARSIVRVTQDGNSRVMQYMPKSVSRWIDSRFNKQEAELNDGAAFDVVRAAINLVLASMLITIGTNYKLPLSTTYVTFMVAMGSSLADRAWSRESAVFRVTGVISVIGGWFITAAVAFGACAIVCLIMFYGGILAKILFMVLVVVLLIKSNRKYASKEKEGEKEDVFRLMMRTRDPEIVLASMLITIGTNYKLPLSTTYVTFMVAMGSSLADRAWSRESAVFRVTGVISVIGGWFITAAVAFGACAIVCLIMFYGGILAKILFMVLVVVLLIKSNRKYASKEKEGEKEDVFRLMMRTRDPEIVLDLLMKHVSRTLRRYRLHSSLLLHLP